MEDCNHCNDILISASEFIKDRLYFVTLSTKEHPKPTQTVHYFSIEDQLVYQNFYNDFGPLNISMLYHYCMKLNKKLKYLVDIRIVHTTTNDQEKRANAACLIGSYAIIYLNYDPNKVFEVLSQNNKLKYKDFRDASIGEPYTISLLDCLNGIYKAFNLGFFDFSSFDYMQYEYYEKVENGDLNWIVPGKFLGFCGPQNKARFVKGYPIHSPELYFEYFQAHNVTCIIRLNKKAYDSNKFVNAGFTHCDLYFVDGSTPTDKILNEFLNICEKVEGAIAVHCKAGLGRTGTLIGCYLMKHYKFTAHEVIAWIRMCRPGSVIGHQQNWLEGKETQMWIDGENYRKKRGISAPAKHQFGIYSERMPDSTGDGIEPREIKINDKVTRILKKVDTMKLNDKDDKNEDSEGSITQGDKLNEIKARRQCQISANAIEKRSHRSRVLVNSIEATSIKRSGKVLPPGIKSSQSTHSRVITKRNDGDETQMGTLSTRRANLRKPTIIKAATVTLVNGKQKVVPKKKDNGWIVEPTIVKNIETCNGDKKDIKSIKRGKRSLTMEKDKTNSPRSVKVLRRSHTQGANSETDVVKPRAKISYP